MASASPSRDPIVGYLSTLESADHGYFGGYLVVSLLGRPLEFHCTAPVRPSRAQQILYGPGLQPYLLGEQIGGTLLSEAKLRPDLILTDQFDAFCLRSQFGIPMVLLAENESETESPQQSEQEAEDGPAIIAGVFPRPEVTAQIAASAESQRHIGPSDGHRFSVGGCDWELPSGCEADRSAALELLTRLAKHVDPAEPFGRIHEAICEAQRIGGRNQDAHGQAA